MTFGELFLEQEQQQVGQKQLVEPEARFFSMKK